MPKSSLPMLAFLLAGMLYPLHSQQYTTAAGLRMGRSVGLTVNQRIANKLSIEGILQTNFSGETTLHGLVRQHRSILTRRANLYYGAGIHSGSTTGIDGMLGVEMTLLRVNASIDIKPMFNVAGVTGFNVIQLQPGASVRYVVFKAGDNKKKRERIKRRKQREREKKRRNRRK